jgi:hypothetical protein
MDGALVGAESLWPSVIRWNRCLGIQWMDGAPVGAESLWPSVI